MGKLSCFEISTWPKMGLLNAPWINLFSRITGVFEEQQPHPKPELYLYLCLHTRIVTPVPINKKLGEKNKNSELLNAPLLPEKVKK